MRYKIYLEKTIQLIIKQKILFIIGLFTLVMLVAIIISSPGRIISPANTSVNLNNPNKNNNPDTILTPGTNPPSSTTVTSPVTKYFYVLLSFFDPSKNNSQLSSQKPPKKTAVSRSLTLPGNPTQTINNQASNPPAGSGGGGENNSANNQSSNGNSQPPGQEPTPTPVTDIQIVFVDENGDYWTYVPPQPPPINVVWMRYINYQDHYSIEYPSDWQMIKSVYNGHESVTLYMPDGSGNIDKPSIAFVGWQANFLGTAAKYTGPITLNGVPGTIYTNGPIGLSSVASVFQYSYGFFALGSSTTTPEFIYVFDHMLRSIEFNI